MYCSGQKIIGNFVMPQDHGHVKHTISRTPECDSKFSKSIPLVYPRLEVFSAA